MATRIWQGDASAVAQVDRFTPANVEIGDTFTLTATAEDGTTTAAVSFVATAGTVANVTDGLVTAWNTSTNALHTVITAADNTTDLTLTADSAGVPFYVASSTVDGGGTNNQTLTRAVVTANSGPNDWNTAANWDAGAVPIAADEVYFENNAIDVLYGLNQSTVTLDSLDIDQTYTGDLGDATYWLRIGTTTCRVGQHLGQGSPTGSPRLKLHFASCSTLYVWDTATTPTDTYVAPLQVKGTVTQLYAFKGKIYLSPSSSDTLAMDDLSVSYLTSQSGDVSLGIGRGLTLANGLVATGGTVDSQGALTNAIIDGATVYIDDVTGLTALTVNSGTLLFISSQTLTTFNNNGGTAYLDKHGIITTANCYGGTTDWTHSNAVRTITTVNAKAGATIKTDLANITMTNKVAASGQVAVTATAA